MAKKLFGGRGNGRFSGGRTSQPELEQESWEQEIPQTDEAPAPELRTWVQRDDSCDPEEYRQDRPARKKAGRGKKIAIVLLSVLLFLEVAYCVVIFTDWIPPVSRLRTMYIETAMSTMRHQWLAKALIPGDVVQAVVEKTNAGQEAQVGVNSNWGDVTEASTAPPKSPSSGFSKDAAAGILGQLSQEVGMNGDSEEFFELFYELDEDSVLAYVDSHPEAISKGWENFWVNEAGLDDDGTTMRTTQGDQVLAVDAANGLIVVRITGTGYRGVLVIGKDPSRLKCASSAYIGSVGQRAGEIAENNDGLVAITGSGFGDGAGVGEGGDLAGAAMSSGKTYGYHYPWGYKRVELHTDNRLYIVDAHTGFSSDCTDATEWTPALIVDGQIVVSANDGYTALNPRACLGQTKDEAILMLGIEGRKLDSVGCDAMECADILARYGAYQAMNVDGGTSAMVWYQGEYIMRCSRDDLPEGRRLPNAWVYCSDTVPDPS